MGMYATKSTAEGSLKVDTQWLKQHDYFCGFRNGGITWTSGFGHKSSISLMVYTTADSPKINFQYSITDRWNGEKKSMDYSFPLIQVPCNIGGFRWAFKCSLFKNGRYCGRTVYTLYKANSDYFGCRHCAGVVYESQRHSGAKFEYFGKLLDADDKIEKLYKTIRKWQYRGFPTRKVKRLRKLEEYSTLNAVRYNQAMDLL
jgi:hypothetical protein